MRQLVMRTGLLLVLLSVSVQALAQQATPTPGPTLNAILSRREVVCGVNQNLFGFGYLDPNTGEVSGFDVDFCRAVAAAVLGDSTLVSMSLFANVKDGEDALQTGSIDLLMHNVNWTLVDDAQGLIFEPVNFYGGETAMVRDDSLFNDWPDLDGMTVCVVKDSRAAASLLPYTRGRNLTVNLLPVASLADGQQSLDSGQCDALSGSIVDLTILRQRTSGAQAYRVWQQADQLYTRDPYAPVIRAGDDQWDTIVRWTLLGLIQAEQLGITSENAQSQVREAASGESDADYLRRVGPDVALFVDPTLGIGQELGLKSNFMLEVIHQVGNFGEIYNRYLGPTSVLPIERGLNSLWKDGGLLYAPAWR